MILSEEQLDYFKEIINIGIGRSANTLNSIVENRVTLKVPAVQLIRVSDLNEKIGYSKGIPQTTISMGFSGELSGQVELVFPSKSALVITNKLANNEIPALEMEQLRNSMLNEIGNIVLNSLIGTLGNLLKIRFNFTVPKVSEYPVIERNIANGSASDFVILAETNFSVKDIGLEGTFILFFEIHSIEQFIALLNKSMH
ncbi:MAG: hypothetical protein EHM93_17910 [Bacteroidales bacterium]|nr:MAG: hypothetical protein EHM93_17910 [Bacteroidales bacterium]